MNSSSNNNHIWSNPHSNVSTPFLDGNIVPPLSPYQGSDGYFTTASTFQSPPPSYWSSLVAEDGLSICSSLSSTPEIIDHQSFVDELFTTNTSSGTDPALFNTNNMPITNQQVMHQQQQQRLMTPLLETSPLTHHVQKSMSYHYQPITHPIQNTMVGGVNYTLDPYTHSTSYQQTNTPFTYNVYDTTTYNTSTVHMRTNNYQQQQQHQHHHHDYTTPIQQETAINHLIATKENSDFPCLEPDCNKVFSRPYNLKSHMRTHTQERPFECDYKKCGWKFARIHDLKRHILKHTGVQPHGCEFCYKRFARSDALKRHWKVDTQCSKSLSEYKLHHDGKEPTSNSKKRKRASPK